MSFKIFRKNCCGLDVHKTWIYACIGITDTNGRTDYKQTRFSSFSKGLKELSDWLAKYHCTEVCMESTGKYWIPVFNVLEKAYVSVILSHPNPDKPEKLFLFSTPCVILKKKGVFICYSLINTLIKFMASLPVMTA